MNAEGPALSVEVKAEGEAAPWGRARAAGVARGLSRAEGAAGLG